MFLPGYGIILGIAIAALTPTPTRCLVGWCMAAVHLFITVGLNLSVYHAKQHTTDPQDRALQALVFGSAVSVGCLTMQWSTLFSKAHAGEFVIFAIFFGLLCLAVKSMNAAIAALVQRDSLR